MTKVKRNPRVFAVVSHELNDKLIYWAQRLGVSKSVLIAMCIQAGLNSVVRSVYPEEVLPADKLAEVVRLLSEKGFDASQFIKGGKA